MGSDLLFETEKTSKRDMSRLVASFLCISPFALEFHFFQHLKNEVAILKIGRAFAYFLREQQTRALTAQGGLS